MQGEFHYRLTQSEEESILQRAPEVAVKRKEKGNRWKDEVLAREKKQSEHNHGPNTSLFLFFSIYKARDRGN
jgi:hypothetical protein